MPRFAANLTMMFTDLALLDRIDAAAAAGFEAIEVLFPYEAPAAAVAERVHRHGLAVALFNMPPGDWAGGERGLATLAGRQAELEAGLSQSITYAKAAGARALHLMAGLSSSADPAAQARYRSAVELCAHRLAEHGLTLLLEPLNRRDMPGYFLDDFAAAERLITELALPNLKLQFDIYHRQIMHGDVASALARLMPMIGHIQIASVPSRHEPDDEELNYPFLFDRLDRLGYAGFVGCEYRPRGGTLAGLGWFKDRVMTDGSVR